jgi:acyl-CoA thioesterase FadM
VPRWGAYEMPVDTGLFTPVGLQPAAMCRIGFNAAGRWLSEHAISHRRLVAEHGCGFVVWSAELNFDHPAGFFDADCLLMKVTARVRGGGTQFECEVEVGDPGAPSRMRACCVPLRLDGAAALSGVPNRLGPEMLAYFLPDEIEAAPHLSPVPALRVAITKGGNVRACGRTPFLIHRHQCEVADQWFWPEAVSLASSGREELVRTHADRVPLLRRGLTTQVRRIDLLFDRPFFLFDEGFVVSSAYESDGKLVFVHELAAAGDGQARAIASEQFT